ncbi:interferon-induced transmembrane protein 5-like [Pelecanus crispus]|uniref:interferon-induced transmembrane protein 5-like n=1 Tax=Pelecanus crispus TaxID=36300 RepID=UPI003F5D019A
MKPRQAEVALAMQPPGGRAAPAAGPEERPRDYVLWSLFNVLLGHGLAYLGCLCFPALLFSIKARDCKVLGDLEGARRHAARAKAWNITCTLLMVLTVVIVIIMVIVVALQRTTT